MTIEEKRSERRRVRTRQRRSEWAEWLRAMLFALVVAVLIRTFFFEVTTVDGYSMQNTLFDAQRVLVYKFGMLLSRPRRFEVVICKYPGESATFVKRVMGLPGDEVEIFNSVMYINGVAVNEPYIDMPAEENFGPVIVPGDAYLVMGDNRNRSTDSRYEEVGAIPKERIRGKAIAVVWPLSQMHAIDQYAELNTWLARQHDAQDMENAAWDEEENLP